MSSLFLFYIISFCILHCVVAIFFKKKLWISYDRKTLIATFFFFISALLVYFFGNVDSTPQNASLLDEKIYWLILIAFGSFSIIQFFMWAFYSLLTHYKLNRLPRFMFNMFALAVVIVIVVLSAKYFFALNLAAFLVTSTVISAIIGLSVQDTLTNLFAGVSLQSEAPFNLGEWVFVGGQEGKVVNQNWRSLTLLSRANHRITLPNKLVAQEKIVNYSRPTPMQIHIFDVGIDYSHPPNEVKKILNKVLSDMTEVSIDDTACPFVKEYADSGIIYSLKFWIEDYGLVPFVQDKVLSRLWYALNRKNIKIPYPINEVHLQMMDTQALQKDHIFNKEIVVGHLSEQDWLQNLNEEQIGMLAETAWLESYAQGEILINEGQEGDSMFIIVKGKVNVLIKNPEGENVFIADKSKGSFFGEMSLLTGKPRTATIKADEDCTVIVIDKKSFIKILMKDAQILDLFFNALESNQSALKNHLEEFANKEDKKEPGRVILMRKIKSYLNIAN